MTRTTEQLRERIRGLEITLQHKNWEAVKADLECLKELLAVREAQSLPVGVSKIIQIAAEFVKGDLLSALWEEAEKSKNIRTERLQRLLDDAGEAMKLRAIQLKQACENTAPPAPAVQAVPDAITVDNAPEIFEIAAQVERIGLSGAYGAYASGWNACRAAMLAAAPTPTKAVPDA